MPEGPEAHVIADGLRDILTGRMIVSIIVINEKRAKQLECLRLPAMVTGVTAHGKRPIICTRQGYLITFLSLSGRWSIGRKENASVILTVSSDVSSEQLDILDALDISDEQYHFELSFTCNETGYVEFTRSPSFASEDWLVAPPTFEKFVVIVRSWKRQGEQVGKFLLDPVSNATIGNYLKSEILYASSISPYRVVSSLTDADIRRVYDNTLNLARLSYQQGGFSMQHYFKVDGEKGSFACEVYGMKVTNDGREVIKVVLDDNRVTYWVPSLQI